MATFILQIILLQSSLLLGDSFALSMAPISSSKCPYNPKPMAAFTFLGQATKAESLSYHLWWATKGRMEHICNISSLLEPPCSLPGPGAGCSGTLFQLILTKYRSPNKLDEILWGKSQGGSI